MSRGDHILSITSDGPALSDDHATESDRSAEGAEHRDGRSRVRTRPHRNDLERVKGLLLCQVKVAICGNFRVSVLCRGGRYLRE
jgi:hypothetical protein